MLQYGLQWKFNVLLLTWLTTAIPNILTTSADENVDSHKFDVIDVAKQQAASGQLGGGKGHTTRIFTTEDVDANFWLKYLGEEFRHAVHLQVDDDNNVRPIHTGNHEGSTLNTTNEIKPDENRTRFARESAKEIYNKHIPVESTLRDDNDYPTEEPESFNNDELTTTTATTPKPLHKNTQHDKILKHKEILMHNKYKKVKMAPHSPLKAIHAPIVVNLPDTQTKEYQINNEEVPVVVQMPPVIYHQKADSYPEIYHAHIPNLHVKQHNTQHQYSPTHSHSHDTLHHQHHTHEILHKEQFLPKYPYQTLPLPPRSQSQMIPPSFVIPTHQVVE